jgi:hypothetical protein
VLHLTLVYIHVEIARTTDSLDFFFHVIVCVVVLTVTEACRVRTA